MIWTFCSPFLGLAALVSPSLLMLPTQMMRRAYFLLRPSQLTILMKSSFDKDCGKNETDEQAQMPSKEKDIESIVSSQC